MPVLADIVKVGVRHFNVDCVDTLRYSLRARAHTQVLPQQCFRLIHIC